MGEEPKVDARRTKQISDPSQIIFLSSGIQLANQKQTNRERPFTKEPHEQTETLNPFNHSWLRRWTRNPFSFHSGVIKQHLYLPSPEPCALVYSLHYLPKCVCCEVFLSLSLTTRVALVIKSPFFYFMLQQQQQ